MKRVICLYLVCFMVLLCGFSVKTSAHEAPQVTRMATKMLGKNVAKTSEKRVIKVMSKGVLKEVPVGKEALKVVCHADGSCTPVIHNLNKNAAKFSDEFNAVILRERRKAITENHQFIPIEQLNKTKPKANLVEGSSRSKLRNNIYARMEKEYVDVAKGFGGTEAHHVVEGNAPAAAKSREILKKFRIGINDAENGILLPSDVDKSIYRGALHNTSHSEKYSEFVYSKIKNVKSKEELVLRLTEIKKALVNGHLDLAGNVSSAKGKLVF